MDVENKIKNVLRLVVFLGNHDVFENRKDIRSITIHTLAQTTQNHLISLTLSKELKKIEYVKKNISDQFDEDDIGDLDYNFSSFITNAFLINFFVYVENHIRQIATYYEKKNGDLNEISITKTFNNLLDKNKVNLFHESVTSADKEIFEFYCFLRNTMHNGGFHTKSDIEIKMLDKNSVFDKKEFTFILEKNKPNNVSFEKQLFLHEQISKVILKINACIPHDVFIKHRFTQTGFN